LAHDPERLATLHTSMSAFTLRSMDALLDNAELASVNHLLDMGGGDGTTAFRFAARYPNAKVTVFDMPSVTKLAAESLPQDLTERVRMTAGDVFADPWPRDVDAILFSHVLEVFSADRIIELLSKAFEVLPAGGKLLLYGFNASDDETSGVLGARLSLYLNILATGEGMAYPAKDYEEWLRHVGCSTVKTYRNLPYEHGLIVGTKQ
jgi:cyclopropane fatty-acyl-phospholipid synthase-like methyltransferase